MKAILEVSVILGKFRNIDLAQQGLYQFQITIFYQQLGRTHQAQPINLTLIPKKSKRQSPIIIPGSVNEEAMSIKSQVFLVRFAEQKVNINEIAEFYLELDLNGQNDTSSISVKVDLCYVEVNKNSLKHFNFEENLQVQTSKIIKIDSPLRGIVENLPVYFSGKWFCMINCVVAMAFYDYKIPCGDLAIFAIVLFADNQGNLKTCLTNEEIDNEYDKYVLKLAKVHQDLKEKFEEINTACFVEDIELPAPLILPLSFEQKDSSKSFAEHLQTTSPITTISQILSEIKLVAASTYETLNLIKKTISCRLNKVCKYLSNSYNHKLKLKFSELVRKEEKGKNWNFDICSSEETKTDHKKKAKLIRKSEYFLNMPLLDVQQDGLIEKITIQPILFEETYVKDQSLSPSLPKSYDFHLIVLVHGFQGSSFDLRSLRNYILLVYPKVIFLESSCNEGKTEGDIREMGCRLSREVISYLSYNFPDKSPRVSFIGHSLGGLIIRAALPYLECLSDRMHLFMSLSTPHLGLMYSSKIVDAGIWIMKKMRKSKCLKQLCFEDYPKVEGTYLYLLSNDQGLQWFEYVALVGSLRDEYGPYDSARIEVPIKASKDPERGNFYIQMAHNILKKLTKQTIIKLDVHFKLKKSIETMIGRSAHLQLLENESFLKTLVYNYTQFFM